MLPWLSGTVVVGAADMELPPLSPPLPPLGTAPGSESESARALRPALLAGTACAGTLSASSAVKSLEYISPKQSVAGVGVRKRAPV